MLQSYSKLKVADNSGGLEIRIIQPATPGRSVVSSGDTVTATVKSARPIGQVKKGQVVKALIIRSRKPYQRADGTTVAFGDNAAVLISDDGSMIGSRIIGPVAKEVREKGFLKVAQLAKEVI